MPVNAGQLVPYISIYLYLTTGRTTLVSITTLAYIFSHLSIKFLVTKKKERLRKRFSSIPFQQNIVSRTLLKVKTDTWTTGWKNGRLKHFDEATRDQLVWNGQSSPQQSVMARDRRCPMLHQEGEGRQGRLFCLYVFYCFGQKTHLVSDNNQENLRSWQELFSTCLVHVNIILNWQKRCTPLETDNKGRLSWSLMFPSTG